VLYGTTGALAMRNVGGSFYDFEALYHRQTSETRLVSPPDDWSGRAIRDWARRLGEGERFDDEVEHVVEVAEVIDRIYGRAP
jgi:hypothetical protein